MEFLYTNLILAAAYFFDGVFGFGAGMISLPLLSQIYPIKVAVTLLLCIQAFMAIAAFNARKEIDWGIIKAAGPAALIGALFGTFALSSFDDQILKIVLGLVILVYLLKEFFFSDVKLGQNNRKVLGAAGGLLGGLLQGAFSVGGPGFMIFLNEAGLKGPAFRASILCLFFLCNLVRAITSASTGLFTEEVLILFVKTSPVVILAIFVGVKAHLSVSSSVSQKVIYLILSFACYSFLKEAF